ncbi:MAG TPA: enoyl-CoA hydratase-related protein [Acidimicrobiales bacterium]
MAVLAIDRPDARNALSLELLAELERSVRALGARPDIRAVVLAGSDAVFSAGADLKERGPAMATATGIDLWRDVRSGTGAFGALASLPQPSIAAISGYALGGGLELALACDLRVAAPGAQLGLPEAKIGMLPAAGGTQRLPRLVGPSRAARLMFTAEIIGADEALRIGLVDEVAQDWLGAAVAMGERIAANSPLAVQLIKQAISVGLESSLDAGLRVEAAALGLLATAEDRAEGLTAHLQKRSPEWKGR